MAKSTPKLIIERIETASPISPIAVFEHPEDGKLDAVFAATFVSKKEIAAGCHSGKWPLVGVFDQTTDIAAVKKQLYTRAGSA